MFVTPPLFRQCTSFENEKNALHHTSIFSSKLKVVTHPGAPSLLQFNFSQHRVTPLYTHTFMTSKKFLNHSQTCTTLTPFQRDAHSCVLVAVSSLHVMQRRKIEVLFKHQQRWIARLYKEQLEQMFPESERCVGEASKHFFGKLAATVLWERFCRCRKTDQIITGYTESVSNQQRSLKPPTHRVVLAV